VTDRAQIRQSGVGAAACSPHPTRRGYRRRRCRALCERLGSPADAPAVRSRHPEPPLWAGKTPRILPHSARITQLPSG